MLLLNCVDLKVSAALAPAIFNVGCFASNDELAYFLNQGILNMLIGGAKLGIKPEKPLKSCLPFSVKSLLTFFLCSLSFI